jgi:hypothetical protein
MAKSGRSFPFLKKRALLSKYGNDVKKKLLISAVMKIIFITAVWCIQRGSLPKGMRMDGAERLLVSIVHHISPKSRKKLLHLGR